MFQKQEGLKMKDTVEAEGGQQGPEPENGNGMAKANKPALHSRAVKFLSPRESYNNEYEDMVAGEKPSRFEVWAWYLYEFCSYFVQTVLIPVVFPLIISQLQHLPTDHAPNWAKNHPGMHCSEKEFDLYSKLTTRTISAGSNFSSLQWTSIAWSVGLGLAAPILAFISFHLDGHFQKLITVAATGIGALFCLPAGFFRVTAIFIPYIAVIVAASTVAIAAHTHHLGLMIRGFTGPTLRKTQFSIRQGVSGWLSLYATAAGCFGAALISAFTYHMLRVRGSVDDDNDDFISLWIVSIFSGLIWLVGVIHVVTASNGTSVSISFSSSKFHPFSPFKYPHAVGALAAVFLSSFTVMSIFQGGVIFIVGQLCIKPVHLLYFWLTYFLFPLVSLPLLQPLQQLMKANSVKMQIVGFLLSLLSSGFGFYFQDRHWKWSHLLIFGAIQSTATGILHAFGRVLVLDCAPSGKEGAFSAWFAWIRAAGLCVGFTMGSAATGHIRTSFGAAFCTAIAGIVVLLFGNVSDVGGAVAAGNVGEDSDERSSSTVHGLDSKQSLQV